MSKRLTSQKKKLKPMAYDCKRDNESNWWLRTDWSQPAWGLFVLLPGDLAAYSASQYLSSLIYDNGS